MTYIHSPDGVTNYRRHRELPARHWEETATDTWAVIGGTAA